MKELNQDIDTQQFAASENNGVFSVLNNLPL